MARFLGSPSQIRTRLRDHLQDTERLDMAVAFISSEWLKLLEGYSGRCRVICWLRTTNTNPYAVEEMMNRPRFRVRHMDFMHAKVYLSRNEPRFAIAGSANISSAALSTNDTAGNVEAALETTRAVDVAEIAAWFDTLWQGAWTITPADMSVAKKSWDSKPKPNRMVKRAKVTQRWKTPTDLKALAAKVRHMPNWQLRMEGYDAVNPLVVSRIDRDDLEGIVDSLVHWARHRGKFAPLARTPLPRVMRSFQLAFDPGIPDAEKMAALVSTHKLPGLSVRAWSMILNWREPTEYVPFNGRTLKFIKDMGLDGIVSPSATPQNYGRWMVLCRELATRLRLRTPGHVDRMVWEHTKDMTEKERGE